MEHQVYNAKDLIKETYQGAKDRLARGKELSITSLPTLDNLLWGLNTEKLVIIGARPSMGKSSVSLQLAYDFAKQGKKIYFFTFEMTPRVCLERLISSQLSIDNRLLTTGEIAQHDYDEKINSFFDTFPSTLVIIDQIGRNIGQLIRAIQKLGSDVDAVFIDYVQMIKGIGNRTDKQTMDEYLTILREQAIRHKFCAIVASQINRDAGGNEPKMWELKSSGTLEEHADIVMLLHWGFLHSRETDKRNDYWLHVAKNRDGQTGKISREHGVLLRYYPQFSRVQEEPLEDEWIGF